MAEINARLDQMAAEVLTEKFLKRQGLGNEQAFYIFDYEPKEERSFRKGLATKLDFLRRNNLHVLHLDLFDLMIRILKRKKLYEKVLKREQQKGSAIAWESLKKSISAETLIKEICDDFEKMKPPILFLSGIGRIWPVARGHTILNLLQEKIDHCPLVMFFAGHYSGQELKLFNKFRDDNYYRAFPLSPRKEIQ